MGQFPVHLKTLLFSRSVKSDSLWLKGLYPASVHGISPGKNTGLRCHSLLQGTFPTQGLNLCLLLGRRIFTTESQYVYINYKSLIPHGDYKPHEVILYLQQQRQ